MTAQERFAEDWHMPLPSVKLLAKLAARAGKSNEHYCNGDTHEYSADQTDKNENALRWGIEVNRYTDHIVMLIKPYGFTAIEYTGLSPTLKRGEQFVEIPY